MRSSGCLGGVLIILLGLAGAGHAGTCEWQPAGRGGDLLPGGYLGTRGSQIVDAAGEPVRIAAIGWDGSDGPIGSPPHGLWTASYRQIIDSIKAAGFNTIRLPWADADLDLPPVKASIDFSVNPDLRGLTVRQVLHRLVDYATTVGLKIIFDHHSDDGCCGQQRNGLWFDRGEGSDDTDGGGHRGSVSAAQFLQDWLRFVHDYAGNATVIGFDLDNEPTSAGDIDWGKGGPTDIKAMYQSVGNAILAIDPGALIIVEGPQNYQAPAADSGMAPGVRAPEGNLTGVATDPVVLAVPDKLVYSVHEYPNAIAKFPGPDFGTGLIARMDRDWGWIVRGNIAPVWIGEMGSSMRTPASRAWARTLLEYMQQLAPPAGQPVGGSWWHIGVAPDDPDGLQTAWGTDHYRPAQLAVTDLLLFRPGAARRCPPAGQSASVR